MFPVAFSNSVLVNILSLFRSCDALYWEHVKEKVTHGSNITLGQKTPTQAGEEISWRFDLSSHTAPFLFLICTRLLPLVGAPVVERCTPSFFLDGVSIMSVLFHSDFLPSIVVCQRVHSDSAHISACCFTLAITENSHLSPAVCLSTIFKTYHTVLMSPNVNLCSYVMWRFSLTRTHSGSVALDIGTGTWPRCCENDLYFLCTKSRVLLRLLKNSLFKWTSKKTKKKKIGEVKGWGKKAFEFWCYFPKIGHCIFTPLLTWFETAYFSAFLKKNKQKKIIFSPLSFLSLALKSKELYKHLTVSSPFLFVLFWILINTLLLLLVLQTSEFVYKHFHFNVAFVSFHFC